MACRAEAASSAEQASREGGSNSVVESQPSKLLVAGSIPVSRSSLRSCAPDERVSYGWQASEPYAGRGLRSADLSAVAAKERSQRAAKADVAQLAERVLGKDEVTSSILVIGSIRPRAQRFGRATPRCLAKAAKQRRRTSMTLMTLIFDDSSSE